MSNWVPVTVTFGRSEFYAMQKKKMKYAGCGQIGLQLNCNIIKGTFLWVLNGQTNLPFLTMAVTSILFAVLHWWAFCDFVVVACGRISVHVAGCICCCLWLSQSSDHRQGIKDTSTTHNWKSALLKPDESSLVFVCMKLFTILSDFRKVSVDV